MFLDELRKFFILLFLDIAVVLSLGIFERKKKREEKQTSEETARQTLLNELCGNDLELKKALSKTLLLNPRITGEMGSIEMHIENAQEYEKNKDNVRARIEYQVAGELALYEGNLTKVQKLFKKAAEADPNYQQKSIYEYYTRKENAEKALAAAKEYYARTIEPTEKK